MNAEMERWVELAERAQRVAILAGLIRIRQGASRTGIGAEASGSDFPTAVVGVFKSSAAGAPPLGAVHNNYGSGDGVHGSVKAMPSIAGGRVGLSLRSHNMYQKGRWAGGACTQG